MPVKYLHYAHLLENSLNFKLGEKLEKGHQIAKVGKTGTKYPHLHLECKKDLYGGSNFYPWRHGRAFLDRHYVDPMKYLAQPDVLTPMIFDHFGYEYGDKIGWLSYHPGTDLNNGLAYADLGQPLWLCQRATPIYAQYNTGWGLHAIFELDETEKPLIQRVNEALRTAGAKVNFQTSSYWQYRVAQGDKKDFIDLVNGIKYRIANNLYPHN